MRPGGPPRRTVPAGVRVWTYRAAGNVYRVLSAMPDGPTVAWAGELCAPLGSGHGGGATHPRADGLAIEVPAPPAAAGEVAAEVAAGVRIVNPDGSAAETSGNGVRIFARWLHDQGRVGASSFVIDTGARRVRCTVTPDRETVTAEMGSVRVLSRDVLSTVRVGERAFAYVRVDAGNPHAVVPVATEPDETMARRWGPAIERHPSFPHRTNVQFARAERTDTVRAVVWERGAGWTLASGSSACAVAAAFRHLGQVGDAVEVIMPGGTLRVTMDGDRATLDGVVARVTGSA